MCSAIIIKHLTYSFACCLARDRGVQVPHFEVKYVSILCRVGLHLLFTSVDPILNKPSRIGYDRIIILHVHKYLYGHLESLIRGNIANW